MVLAAVGFSAEPADAARQCATWRTGGAVRRSGKPHSDSDEGTPFARHDRSLLTMIESRAVPPAEAEITGKTRPCWERTSWDSPRSVGSAVGSRVRGWPVGTAPGHRPGRDGARRQGQATTQPTSRPTASGPASSPAPPLAGPRCSGRSRSAGTKGVDTLRRYIRRVEISEGHAAEGLL